MVQRLHVVEPVGELHEQHADVAGHRQDELLEVLRLRGFLRHEVELVELGHPVDQLRHIGAEAHLDVADVDLGILDHVMQQAGDDGHLVEAHIGEQVRDPDRMGVIRLAGIALLRAVMLDRKIIRLTEQFGAHARMIGANFRDQFGTGWYRRQRVGGVRRSGLFASGCASPFFRSGKGAAVHFFSYRRSSRPDSISA